MRFQVEGAHEGVGNRPASLVLFRMEHRVNSQACLGGGAANNCEEELPRTQRRAGAVAADEAEQTMLDRVPFATAGWVVAHGDLESQSITEQRLEPLLPESRPAAVSTPAARAD